MKNEFDLYEDIDRIIWKKKASFYISLSEHALLNLVQGTVDIPYLKEEKHTCGTLEELITLCKKKAFNKNNTLVDLDEFLTPDGSKSTERTLFTIVREGGYSTTTLQASYYTIISSAGYIGSHLGEQLPGLEGGGCYVGNTELSIPFEHAIKAGLITNEVMNPLALDLSNYDLSQIT